jgi:hypothetical protein
MDRQGQLLHLNVKDLKTFERVSDRFTPFSSSSFRKELLEEFGGSYEVSGTTHYLVCAPRGHSRRYAELFETIYRDTEQFYRVRGFAVNSPEVPLVAIVFGTQQEFVQYCIRDSVRPSAGLMGYYSLRTNRVALFDDSRLVSSVGPAGHRDLNADTSIAGSAAISGGTADTIIHETTHQVGYNIGIHSRLGGTPLWVVEGLATVLEPTGMRHKTGRKLLSKRINSERLDWFTNTHRPDRTSGYLARLIADEKFFHQSTLDSYSESWALVFFMMENPARRKNFAAYLRNLGTRDPLKPYTSTERLDDFQTAFGDISRLEVEFLRFMDRL